MASNATFRADSFLANGQPNIGTTNPNNILRPNAPLIKDNPSTFISPQKHSSSSINPHSTMESFLQNFPSQHFTNTQINSTNHIAFKSPPNHAYQSPVKVKVNYFSPQKTYFWQFFYFSVDFLLIFSFFFLCLYSIIYARFDKSHQEIIIKVRPAD